MGISNVDEDCEKTDIHISFSCICILFVLVIYCRVTITPKHGNLKQQAFIISLCLWAGNLGVVQLGVSNSRVSGEAVVRVSVGAAVISGLVRLDDLLLCTLTLLLSRQFTHLKNTIQYFSVYSQACASIIKSNFGTFLFALKDTLYLTRVPPILSAPLQPYLFPHICLFWTFIIMGIIHYVSFQNRFLPLSIRLSNFIHVVLCINQ